MIRRVEKVILFIKIYSTKQFYPRLNRTFTTKFRQSESTLNCWLFCEAGMGKRGDRREGEGRGGYGRESEGEEDMEEKVRERRIWKRK